MNDSIDNQPKPKNWAFVIFAVPAQLGLIYIYLILHASETGVPLTGKILSLLTLLVAPSALLWLVLWLIFRSKSILLKLFLLGFAIGVPVFLYSFLKLVLQGFSH